MPGKTSSTVPSDAARICFQQTLVELSVPLDRVDVLDARQLQVLRRHVPALRAVPVGELRAHIASSPTLSLGSVSHQDATALTEILPQTGMPVYEEVFTQDRVRAFDKRLGMPCTMNDKPTTELLITQMIADGVPAYLVEDPP